MFSIFKQALRQAPPAPDAYGLSDATTVLQVYSEFFNTGDPAATAVTNGNVLDDRVLNFGAMSMGVGHALFLNGQQTPISGSAVNKQWIHVNNRTFLVESVPWSAISNQVQALHPSSNLNPRRASIRGLALLESGPKSTSTGKAPSDRTAMRLAEADTGGKRVVVDWDLLSGSANVTLQGDTTYLVSSLVNATGVLTIEGGAVVKYATNSTSEITVSNPIVFDTAPYRPAVFTSVYDGTVGASISNGTPAAVNPYAYLNLSLYTSQTFRNCRFSYASAAVSVNSEASSSIKLWDCQFFNCSDGLEVGAYTGVVNLYAYNVLFAHVGYGIAGSSSMSVAAVNVTGDNMEYLIYGIGSSDVFVTNCVLTSVTNLPSSSSLYNCSVYSSSSGVYQTTGAGGYYLNNSTPGSTNRGAGTASIDTGLSADLQTLTTYPPAILPIAITTSTNLTNQVPRNTGLPDRGYHYCPIDYAANLEVSGATITIAPGIAVCSYGNQNGIYLGNNGNLQSAGTATSPAYIVRYNTVQEQSNTNWEMIPGSWEGSVTTVGIGGWATFSFTDWAALEQDYQIYNSGYSYPFNFQNCQFYNGQMKIWGAPDSSTNCLYQRVAENLTETSTQIDTTTFYNNLLWNGSLTVKHGSSSSQWTFRDNLFDQCNITNKSGGAYMNTCASNAYATNLLSSPQYLPGDTQSTIVPLAASPAYQTGTLGQFYYPLNQTNLIFYGSQLASAAGLYHYTVTTNNAIEGTNMVSIGFHYVATDNNGNPLDTDGDGLPDYIKDANGDGVYDAGDLVNWQNPFNIYDQGSNYGGFRPANVRLGYWRFNNASSLANEHGDLPTANVATSVSTDWSGSSVGISRPGTNLQYLTEDSDGWTNFDTANGTVRFWFRPSWSSTNVGGTGPGQNAAFLDFVESSGFSWELYAAPNGQVLEFQCSSNFINGPDAGVDTSTSPGNWVCTFVKNQWYQIALTYSPSNIAAYVNGALIGTATWPAQYSSASPIFESSYGMFVWPTIGTTLSFAVGSDVNSQSPMNGEMDELETFNYPLSAQAIAYGFATFNGCSTNNTTDSDYVGRNDVLRTLVDGVTLPAPNNVTPCRLGYWRFDSPLWIGEQGQFPITAKNVTMGTGWSGGALNVGSAANSALTYPDVYTNGWANINCHQGTVRFWFEPNWNSGSAPSAPFISLGNGTTNVWTLELTGGIPQIQFLSTSNSAGGGLISAPLSIFASNQWCQIVLTYGSTGCALYTNGMLAVTNPTGVGDWPNSANRATGMIIGNNSAYNSPINGKFDELETFNYQLNTNQIWTNFQAVWNIDNNLDGVPDIIQDTILNTNTPFLGQPVSVAGTIEAEQFDRGGPGYAYTNVATNPASNYRSTGMCITTNNMPFGYCLDQTRSNEWASYTIDVLVPQTYAIETRVQGLGTNSTFELSFAAYNGSSYVTYTNTGPLTNGTTTWTNITGYAGLKAGTNIMTLKFLNVGTTNNQTATYVGRFDYMTVYPWWQAGFTSTYTNSISSSVLSNNINTWTAATNNAIQIQNAVNDVKSHTNGTVLIPAGTYYVAQLSPNETNYPFLNAAVSILGTNVAISGAGMMSTILVAYNRATSIFYLGQNTNDVAQCTNITFLNMTMEGQQHEAVSSTNSQNTVYESGEFLPINGRSNTVGMLLGIEGIGTTQFAYNILVSNCQFLNADRPIDIVGNVSNVMVRQSSFLWQSNLYVPGVYDLSISNSGNNIGAVVGVFGRLPIYNIGFLENTYLGGTNTGMNYITNQLATGNGFVFCQGGGNSFALRNAVTNNAEEAMQFMSGPVAVAGNTFWSLAVNDAACALAPNMLIAGVTGTGYSNYSETFVGNSVTGNAYGAANDATNIQGPYTLNFSGNSLTVFLPPTNPSDFNIYLSTGALVWGCQNFNFCGNTMTGGETGVMLYSTCSNSVILANNFSGVTRRSIIDGGVGSESSQAIGNILSRGNSYHLRALFPEGPNWFLYNNQYVEANSNSVPPFTDPVNLPAHISN